MRKIIIVAMNHNGVIGVGNNIPWYLPEDLKHYKENTLNNFVVMGRVTYESLPKSAKLNRNYIVLSKNKINSDVKPHKQVISINEMHDYINKLNDDGIDKIYIAGGGKIYDIFIHESDEILLTLVDVNIKDNNITYFPLYILQKKYKIIEESIWMVSKKSIKYKLIKYIFNEKY